MARSAEQPDFMDSLDANQEDYCYSLDMLCSPLFQPQQEEEEAAEAEEVLLRQQQLEMTAMVHESLGKCLTDAKPGSDRSHGQASGSGLEETLRQTEVFSESLDHNVDRKGSGSAPALDQPKDAQATRPKRRRPRKKGLIWTQAEHELFLEGVEMYGKGDWKSIAKNYVHTRTSAQVASHAQKHFGRMKKNEKPNKVEKPPRGRRSKRSKASKGSSVVTKHPIHQKKFSIVHPTFYVPPPDNGNVPPTDSNPQMDFGRFPFSYTNSLLKGFCRFDSSIYIPTADSATFSLTDPNPLSKFAKVCPTSYAPRSNSTKVQVFPNLYLPPSNNINPSFEDLNQPSTDFPINPTSDSTTILPNPYIPPSENIYSNSDPHILTQDSISPQPSTEISVHPTISVPPSNDLPINPDVDFPSLDFLEDPSLGSIASSPLYCSFKFTDLDESPTLDFLDTPPLNINTDIHNTIQVPPSDVNTSPQSTSLPQNDQLCPAGSF
ncbi:hypothetical protein MLD38_031107 [Melastoma candidum]|uniref:Uncharacterized protein n=1 Tax=Melastoma candidum TaxID=119954 RepID=A0ACB9MNN7_9MYRT|nr:hypothetical protein MLD38_031107 [Melastoma candidum]